MPYEIRNFVFEWRFMKMIFQPKTVCRCKGHTVPNVTILFQNSYSYFMDQNLDFFAMKNHFLGWLTIYRLGWVEFCRFQKSTFWLLQSVCDRKSTRLTLLWKWFIINFAIPPQHHFLLSNNLFWPSCTSQSQNIASNGCQE